MTIPKTISANCPKDGARLILSVERGVTHAACPRCLAVYEKGKPR